MLNEQYKMNKNYILYFTFAIITMLSMNANASESALIALGKAEKDSFYAAVSSQTATPVFPALYIYNTKEQQFLTKQQVEEYLGALDQSDLWQETLKNWVKDSSQFKTDNATLSNAVPTLQLDREYLIYYDNLPAPMLEQFKTMEPNLIEKDYKLKSIISTLESSRSYSTYQ